MGGKKKLFPSAKKPDRKTINMSGSSVLQRKRLCLFDPQGLHKGDSLLHPLPQEPPPQSGRYPIQGGMREVISGRGGHWGPRKLGIDSPGHQQPVRPNPRDEFPARTSVPSHKHKHGMQGCACPASRWYCNSRLPPNTYVHNSLDSNWE